MNPIKNYPLHWPAGRPRTPASQRKRAPFRDRTTRVTVHVAIRRVLQEVKAWTRSGQPWRCNPEDVIVSTNQRPRLDGLPYSDAPEPADPGAAVYFELDGKPHCLSCDRWDRLADNLAAIAKHLEATRGMERWGVADLATLFAGFAALPAHVPPQPWREVLNVLPGCTLDQAEAAYRLLALAAHPDRGGTSEQMAQLNTAIERARKELS